MFTEPLYQGSESRVKLLAALDEGLKSEQYHLDNAKGSLPEWQKKSAGGSPEGVAGLAAIEKQITGLTAGVTAQKEIIAGAQKWHKDLQSQGR